MYSKRNSLRSRRSLLLGGAVAVTVAMVAACSAQSDGTGSDGGGTSASGGGALTKVRLTQPTATTLWAPLNVAQDMGYFKQNGLDVSITVTGGASQAIGAVLAGSADISGGGMSDDIQLAGQGRGLIAFASMVDRAPDDVAVSNEFVKKSGVSPTAPVADRVHALKGATIGITSAGALPEQILSWLLSEYGMDAKSDIKTVPLHDPATALAALDQGRVDGLIFPPPAPQSVVQSGKGVTWVNVAGGEVNPGYWTGLMAKPDYLKSHADVVEAMTKSVAQALAYIRSNPDDAAELVHKHFSDQDQATFDVAWKEQAETFAKTVDVTQDQFDGVMKFLKSTDVKVPDSLSFDDVATNEFAQKVGDGS